MKVRDSLDEKLQSLLFKFLGAKKKLKNLELRASFKIFPGWQGLCLSWLQNSCVLFYFFKFLDGFRLWNEARSQF